MLTDDRRGATFLIYGIVLVAVLFGMILGLAVGIQPLYAGFLVGGIAVAISFFANFAQTVLGLLIIRSSLDIFSQQQLPAAFAIGLDILILAYIVVQHLTKRAVHVDRFFWLFGGWVMLQLVWVILLPIGGLGFDGAYLMPAVREWIRIFSWLMVYLLVMQLQAKLHPQQVISALFLGLIIPVTVGLLQTFVPASLLPPMLVFDVGDLFGNLEGASRIHSTLGHPSTFATFLLFFTALTVWQLRRAQHRLPWLILLATLTLLIVETKALIILVMLFVFFMALALPRLNLIGLLGGLLLFAVVIALFASTEFGRERLASIADTPLLNPDMDVSRAILLSRGDKNSFNWRLSQWYTLLSALQHYPFLGFGLGLSAQIPVNKLAPHNDYLRFLVETGAIGLSFTILFFMSQAVRLVQLMQDARPNSDQRYLCTILLSLLVAILVGMVTENIWSHTTLFFYWWTLMAVVGWDWRESGVEEEEGYLWQDS